MRTISYAILILIICTVFFVLGKYYTENIINSRSIMMPNINNTINASTCLEKQLNEISKKQQERMRAMNTHEKHMQIIKKINESLDREIEVIKSWAK